MKCMALSSFLTQNQFKILLHACVYVFTYYKHVSINL